MNHFLAHEWEKARAQKRGGGQPVFSLDEIAAEERYRLEPSEGATPERIFDRRWALTVLAQAAAQVRDSTAATPVARFPGQTGAPSSR